MIKSDLSATVRAFIKRGPRKKFLVLLYGGTIGCGLILGSTSAYSNSPNPADKITNVYTRFNPAYDSPGVRIGNFILYPSIETATAFSDNIYASDTDPKNDLVYTATPSISASSDFVRHRISFNASTQKAWYQKYSSENYTDYRLSTNGQVDLFGQTAVPFSLSYNRGHYERGTGEENLATTPTVFDLYTASTGLNHNGARVALKALVSVRDYTFEKIDDVFGNKVNDDRNRTETETYASIGLPEDFWVAPFVYTKFLDVSYDRAIDRNGFNRDSRGTEIGAGAVLNISDLTTASFYGGHISRRYDDSRFSDISDIAYGANIVWSPSTLATFTLSGHRDVQESILSGASGLVRSNVILSMRYELFPNLFLDPSLEYSQSEYEGIERDLSRYGAGIGAQYKMNPNLWLSAKYKHTNQDESGAPVGFSDDYKSNELQLSLKLQF